MFSSDNNNYPLFYNESPSFLTNESYNNNIFFQHHYGKFLPPSNSSLSSSYLPIISENSIGNLSSEPSINQQNTTSILFPSDNNNYNNNNVTNRVSSSRRVGGKKDRHTKITTAQGVRDRRVRLSMSIAREFFNLQDMLGFDKASKTLGWLLSKSKPAIDELASNFKSSKENEEEVQHHTDHNKNYDNNCYYKNNNNNIDDEVEKSLSPSKKRKRRENNHLINNNNNSTRNVVDELRRREEARERARERTRKKKIVDDQQRGVHHNNGQDLMICHSNPGIMSNNGLIGKEGGISTERESVIIKGNYNKSRGSSYNNNFNNYEMISSKDEQDYYNYDYFSSSGIMQPNGFPALNIINLSTEIHINARSWDAYSKHIQH